MDSEELKELAELHHSNAPLTRKNAYHVDAVWGGYKGSVTGLLAGLMIGAAAGVMIGGVAVGGIALATGSMLEWGATTAIVGTGAVFGMLHGADKFERIGIAAGTSSAVGNKVEGRMKEYLRSMFVELKREIRSAKGSKADAAETSLLKIEQEKTLVDAVEQRQNDFRVQHCDENHCKDNEYKYVFWNIAAIGALAGGAAGALMSYGLDTYAIESVASHVLNEKALEALANNTAAITLAGAAIGSSFGINRDVFRKIYDVAENLFVGNISLGKAKAKEPEKTVAQAPGQPTQQQRTDAAQPAVNNPMVVSVGREGTQKSETFHQDKLMRELLLSMDHTVAIRQ